MLVQPKYAALGRYPQIEEAYEACKKADVFAFDVEATGFNAFKNRLMGFSVAVDHITRPANCHYKCCPPTTRFPAAWYFQFVPSLTKNLSPDEALAKYPDECVPMRATLDLFGELLQDENKTVVEHNGKFETKFLRRANVEPRARLIDTCVGSWITDENKRSHGLKQIVEAELGHKMVSFEELDTLFAPPISVYGADDAAQTLRIWRRQEPIIRREKLETVFYELECRIPEILADMELRGISIDIPFLKSLGREIHGEMQAVEEECYKLAGRRFNIASSQEIGNLLFNILKWRKRGEVKVGKSGIPSTDKETLEKYADKPLAASILKHRELTKLEGTYIDPLVTAAQNLDGRVRSLFNQIPNPWDGSGGTVTGRLSSQGDDELGGTQLQNIPSRSETGRKVRKAFVSACGCVLCVWDYSQIELRWMAHFSRDKLLLAAYRHWDCVECGKSGETHLPLHACPNCNAPDGHRRHDKKCAICPKIQKPADQPRHGFCLGLDIHQQTADACNVARDLGKIINFALLYGLGPEGLARKLKCDLATAKRIHKAYFRRYEGIEAHNEWVRQQVIVHGYIKTILKRRRRFPHKHGQRLEFWDREWRQAANFIIQGSAADLMKVGMRNIHRRLRKEDRLRHTGLLLQVHDEVTAETPEEEAVYTNGLMRWEMEHALMLPEDSVPIIADGKSAKSWGLAK